MLSKIIGGILLIIGTSIGAGMLALPMATAAGGFYHAFVFMLGAWAFMTIGALLIVEVNLTLPEGSNFISMARTTLGRGGALITWLAMLLLLYSLICAYIAGGSDLLTYLLSLVHIHIPHYVSTILFVIILGDIVFHGVKLVDISNRTLMSVKMIAFVLLVILIMPKVDLGKLSGGGFRLLAGSLMLFFTSFGYATIIPTLRSYFKSSKKALYTASIGGSLISLVCYLAWLFVVQGTIVNHGPHGLVAMAHSGKAASQLTQALSTRLHSHAIDYFTHIFTAICVLTSFLAVTLGLTDFLADGFKVKKVGKGRWLAVLTALVPPMLIVIFDPGLFIKGLNYAGICCVILLMLLPALMAWRGGIQKRWRWVLLLEIVVAIVLICQGVWQQF